VNNFSLKKFLFQEPFLPEHILIGKITIKPMKTSKQTILNLRTISTARLAFAFMLAAGTANHVHAQGQLPSGDIGSLGSGPYTYNLTFSDGGGATSPIGSVWYAWVPGLFFLPGTPTSASAPAGWTANIVNNSIQFIASSPADDILPGQTLSGFDYQATFSPAQLAAALNSGESDAYSVGLFSDAGAIFTVQPVPEPAGPMLLTAGATLLWFFRRRQALV
jgi:hypothetical protein